MPTIAENVVTMSLHNVDRRVTNYNGCENDNNVNQTMML